MPHTARLNHLDLLKFFAIASVILGHAVEQTTGNDFWTNPIWSVIYAYHMPLFMMLCGYFFGSSLKRSFGSMIRRKAIQLLIPSATLTVLVYGLIAVTGFNPFPEMFGADFTSIMNVLWFLKCVFLCYAIAYLSVRLSGNVAVAAIATSILFTILPGGDIVNLNFLLPMFWLGYAFNLRREWCERNHTLLLTVSAIAFFVMLCFWSGLLTIYAVPIAIIDWHNLSVDTANLGVALYRLAIGAAGSVMFFMLAAPVDRLVCRLRGYPALLAIGRATLGIYVVQTIVVECGIHVAGIYLTTSQSFIVAPLLAACGLAACYLCVLALRSSRISRLLLLGETSDSAPRLTVRS